MNEFLVFMKRVNEMNEQQLRDYVREMYGVLAGPDAREAELRQTIVAWSVERYVLKWRSASGD